MTGSILIVCLHQICREQLLRGLREDIGQLPVRWQVEISKVELVSDFRFQLLLRRYGKLLHKQTHFVISVQIWRV